MIRTFLLMVLPLLFIGCNGQGPAPGPDFPAKTLSRVQLFNEDDGIEIRTTDFYPGNEFPKRAKTEYKSGVTGLETFRTNGTLEQVLEYYAQPESGGDRILRLRVDFQEDGKTYQSERFHQENGNLKFLGIRLADGKYKHQEYYPNGTQVKTEKLKSAKGGLLSVRNYRTNGRLEKSYRLVSNVVEETTLYWPTGTVQQVTRSNFTNSFQDVFRELFDQEGELACRVRFTATCLEVAYPTKDNKEVRSYSRYGGLVVTITDNDDKPKFRQHWTSAPSTKDWTKLGDTKLEKVEVFDESGKLSKTYDLTNKEQNDSCPAQYLRPLSKRQSPQMLEHMPLEDEYSCGDGCSANWPLPADKGAGFKYKWWK